ncbi:ABC transporter ATP-binding protein [Paraburkholderia sp. DHOC27]|uniref:ATP-binding cassette domain-containing protein n=1 Tax=Paraburkholderia sp. DHOC27 TaxID=2303330 RepID=UPI000E3C4120|nr:ABC transporter ATP-binding protein [Paraburkholderia sp. DHOC27]RFU48979.1 ABC transporter ATP-binding protein [Paraburkholderia sp. DHOC27]
MLRFENLSKRYGDHVLFEKLRYRSEAGCVALSDEMGSGKTTLLGVLAGAIEQDAGEVWLGGYSLRHEAAKAKAVLTYVPEDCTANPLQTGRAFLEEVAALRRTPLDARALELADRFGLTPHLDKRFEQMSFGTRKKVCFTAAVLGESSVLIADEPLGGLDAPARAVLIDLFTSLAGNCTVLFTSYDAALAQACGATAISFADLAGGA